MKGGCEKKIFHDLLFLFGGFVNGGKQKRAFCAE